MAYHKNLTSLNTAHRIQQMRL